MKKKLDLWTLPPCLIIHLKRFQMHNGRWVKSNSRVEFPVTDFDAYKYSAHVRRDSASNGDGSSSNSSNSSSSGNNSGSNSSSSSGSSSGNNSSSSSGKSDASDGAVEALTATAAATSPQSVAESNAAHADGVQEPQGSALDADAGMKDAVFDNVDDIDFENIDPHLVRA